MRMNRRNVLVGLGTIVAGGGAALGTGAFSSVEANRTVDLQTSGDSSALLSLEPKSSVASDTGGDNNNELIFAETDLNENATTTFDPAFSVQNAGSNNVGFYVKSENTIGINGIIDFVDSSGNSIVQDDHTGGNQIDLPVGSDAVNVGIVVDTGVGDITSIGSVTLVASTDAHAYGQ